MKTTIIDIDGMSCMSCVSSIEKELYKVEGVKQVNIDLGTKQGIIKADDHLGIAEFKAAVENAGIYTATESVQKASIQSEETEASGSYKPLLIVVSYLVGVTLLLEFSSGMFLPDTWMANFMAGFFLIFSFFKMLDIPGFANAYRRYDLVAAKSKHYAYAFPFIELGLGIAYLLKPDSPITHLSTAIIMFVSLVGVVKAVSGKKKIQCACLGTGFNLPMSTVTIIEDGVMLLMALIMLINS